MQLVTVLNIAKFRIVIAFLAATLLSACAVGPDFKTPASNAPQTFAHAAHPEFSNKGYRNKLVEAVQG